MIFWAIKFHVSDFIEIPRTSLADLPVLLEQRRTRIRAELHQKIVDGQSNSCDECKYGKIREEKYKSLLLGLSFQPLHIVQRPICDLIQDVENSKPDHAANYSDLSPRAYCRWSRQFCRIDGRNEFADKIQELKAEYVLSYAAIRAGEANSNK